MAKGLNTAKYARNVEEAIDFAMAAYLNAAQVPSKPNAPIVISATSADIGLTMTQS